MNRFLKQSIPCFILLSVILQANAGTGDWRGPGLVTAIWVPTDTSEADGIFFKHEDMGDPNTNCNNYSWIFLHNSKDPDKKIYALLLLSYSNGLKIRWREGGCGNNGHTPSNSCWAADEIIGVNE